MVLSSSLTGRQGEFVSLSLIGFWFLSFFFFFFSLLRVSASYIDAFVLPKRTCPPTRVTTPNKNGGRDDILTDKTCRLMYLCRRYVFRFSNSRPASRFRFSLCFFSPLSLSFSLYISHARPFVLKVLQKIFINVFTYGYLEMHLLMRCVTY